MIVKEQSIQHSTDDELRHLVQKLKWIGMDRDAEALSRAIREARPHCSLLSEPAETD